jgi:enamine deaminase RidA (YjgF/YER057c/UK114 family)
MKTGLRLTRMAGSLAQQSLKSEDPPMMNPIEERLHAAGYILPPAIVPAGNYVPYTRSGNQLFIAGQLCYGADGKVAAAHIGRVGEDVSIEDATVAARLCALNILAQAKSALGSLDRIERCLRVFGCVNAISPFPSVSIVMNGASDLLVLALGDKGHHARMTIGCLLPRNAAAEVEAVFEVR